MNPVLYIEERAKSRLPLSIPSLQALTGLDAPGVSRLVQAHLSVTGTFEDIRERRQRQNAQNALRRAQREAEGKPTRRRRNGHV